MHASQRNGRGTAASAQLTASLTWHRNSHRALYALLSPVLLAAVLLTACSGSSARPAGTRLPQAKGGSAQSITVFPSTPAPQVDWRREIQIRATVDWYLAHLSLDQKLGQMFLIETVWKNYNDPVGDTDAMVRQMHAGAMIVYGQNVASPQQLRSYLTDIQAHAAIPMMISSDEEVRSVDRLGDSGFAPPLPTVDDLHRYPLAQTRQAGATAARELKSFGMNTDLAPVADVRSVPNAFEGDRLFGDDVATVVRYAGAFLDGLQSQGVIGCVKHWPGIGGLAFGEDPHDVLPIKDIPRTHLDTVDFAAFRQLLSHQPGMVMVTHVIMRAYDKKLPATLSPTLINGILRKQLGYDGVVMTDSLYMGAIKIYLNDQNLYTELPTAAVLSVIAGDDLLEGAFDRITMSNMLDALKAAIKSGRISKARIDQSVRRILTLKARFGLLSLRSLPQT